MAQNYVQPGEAITTVAPTGGITSGAAFLIGAAGAGKVVVALHAAAAGVEIEAATGGVYRLPKVSALAINQGDTVYFDDATKLINKTSASNTKAGWCFKSAANPSGFVEVFLET